MRQQSKKRKAGKRPYRAPRRQAQAEATRRAILDAAHKRFLADGYERTSIRAIAADAKVSEQTVYNVFMDKPSLLVAVGLRVISGELEPALSEEGDFRTQLLAQPGQLERIKVAAAWSRMVWERGMLRFESMLLDAAATDPRAAEVATAIWQRKYDENKELFAIAFPEAYRNVEDEADEAYDVFFALDSAAFVRILVDDRGWSYDAYERWLATILRRLFTRLSDRSSGS
jgi:AcrR family transcriptional regulator